MLTIQRSFWSDKKAAIDAGVDVPMVCTKVGLYQAIALHLGINPDGLDIDQLWAAIDAKNLELACVGIAESMVVNESTVADKMAATLNKPVLIRPVKPVDIGVVIMRPGVKTVQRPKLRKKASV